MPGVLCELSAHFETFWLTWLMISALALVAIGVSSGTVFWHCYVNVTYEKWTRKTNPDFPSAAKVREEVLQMLKGMGAAAVAPALSLWLAAQRSPLSQAYCGVEPHGWGYLVLSFFVIWLVTDFWSFFYHRLGHVYHSFWAHHRAHHVFSNPSPFAVIADECADQLLRAAPLFVLPAVMPINMDMMFATYGIFFYGYGVYLHCGYELEWPDAHHPWINTAFQHHCHHAKAVMGKPYHCGFFLKLWDQLLHRPGLPSVWDEARCFCAKCARGRGDRSRAAWAAVRLPDYSPLRSPAFWLRGAAAPGARPASQQQPQSPPGARPASPPQSPPGVRMMG